MAPSFWNWLRRERVVLERLRGDQPSKRFSEQKRVFPVVVLELKFVEIAIKVLVRHLMERTNQPALEQTKRALDAVGVNVAAHVFLAGVVDRFVDRVLVHDAGV